MKRIHPYVHSQSDNSVRQELDTLKAQVTLETSGNRQKAFGRTGKYNA